MSVVLEGKQKDLKFTFRHQSGDGYKTRTVTLSNVDTNYADEGAGLDTLSAALAETYGEELHNPVKVYNIDEYEIN